MLRTSKRVRLGLPVFSAYLSLSLLLSIGRADETTNTASEVADKPKPLPLDKLGVPPEPLAELIDTGQVRFVVGGRPEWTSQGQPVFRSVTTGLRGGSRTGERVNTPPQFDAETNFTVKMDYRSRCRWYARYEGEKRFLTIKVRVSRVVVEPAHEIWLRQFRGKEGFWDSDLIRHEFDHVKISTSAASAKRFADDLRQHSTIRVEIPSDIRIDQKSVQAIVDKHVVERFDELTELIKIRYRELDRQTNHGMWPLAADSELGQLLNKTQTTQK